MISYFSSFFHQRVPSTVIGGSWKCLRCQIIWIWISWMPFCRTLRTAAVAWLIVDRPRHHPSKMAAYLCYRLYTVSSIHHLDLLQILVIFVKPTIWGVLLFLEMAIHILGCECTKDGMYSVHSIFGSLVEYWWLDWINYSSYWICLACPQSRRCNYLDSIRKNNFDLVSLTRFLWDQPTEQIVKLKRIKNIGIEYGRKPRCVHSILNRCCVQSLIAR